MTRLKKKLKTLGKIAMKPCVWILISSSKRKTKIFIKK